MNTVMSKAMRILIGTAMSVMLALGMSTLAAPRQALAASSLNTSGVAMQQASTLKSATAKTPHVVYRAHEQNIGWMPSVKDGKVAGKTGKKLRAEALKISLSNKPYTGGITYRSYVQGSGWTKWSSNGAVTGTTGKGLRIEALEVKLTGNMAKYYDVYYCSYVQSIGWMGWAKNGANSGTFGKDYRIEAVKIKLVKKGATAPGSTANAYKIGYLTKYDVYVKNLGWKKGIINGKQAGTTGADLSLEAFSLNVADIGITGNVFYRAYVNGAGWSGWRANGEAVGTASSGKQLEAFQIEMSNGMASKYDIYYRVYTSKYGWMGWAKNGATSGTIGYGYRAEAVQVKLVAKGGAAPGSTGNASRIK